MPRLHLLPIPGPSADVIPFPNTGTEDREAVIGQMSNYQTALISRNGGYLGRHKFMEATAAVIVRQAFEVGSLDDARAALLEAFDYERGLMAAGFAAA